MHLLDIPATCQASGSYTCALVFDWTGNANLAHVAAWLIGKPLAIVGLLLIGLVARWLLTRLVDRVVRRAEGGVLPSRLAQGGIGRGLERLSTDPTVSARRAQRARTIGSLLKSIVSGVVFTVITIMVISQLGYNVAPIIAGAGIVGVALGFGSQTLVKDFLSGIFMIFEDQYGVGDVVDVGAASGTIEAVSLRVTRLRDVDGTVWYVRNGEILRVGNMSQNWSRTVLDIPVAYSEDLARVREVLKDVAHQLWDDEDYKGVIIEEPEVWGVQSLEPDSVVVRVTLKTAPMQQWNVAREMRERVKARFDHEGIEIPRPQRVVYQRTPEDPLPKTDLSSDRPAPGPPS
ncbi:MAG: mechanosensitive ion channel family protein [Actinomycetota bacterium]|nr:mechanosensitive ion channel family protein [Actinomycetota bacterium]